MANITHTSTGATNTPRLLSVAGNAIAVPDTTTMTMWFENDFGVTLESGSESRVESWTNKLYPTVRLQNLRACNDVSGSPVNYNRRPTISGGTLAGSPTIRFAPDKNAVANVYRRSWLYKTSSDGDFPTLGGAGITVAVLCKIIPSLQTMIAGNYRYGGGSHDICSFYGILGGAQGLGLFAKGDPTYGHPSYSKNVWGTDDGYGFTPEDAGITISPILNEWVLFILTGEANAGTGNDYRKRVYNWETQIGEKLIDDSRTMFFSSVGFGYHTTNGSDYYPFFGDIGAIYSWNKCLSSAEILSLVAYVKAKYGLT